jgi:hypothetical protein
MDKSVSQPLKHGSVITLRHLHLGSVLASNSELPYEGNSKDKPIDACEVFLDPQRNVFCSWLLEIAFSYPGNAYSNHIRGRVKHGDLVRLKHV